MSRRYQVTQEAQSQLDAIGTFIAQDSVDAALRVLDSLEEAFEQPADMPDIGHMREDLTDKPVKFYRCRILPEEPTPSGHSGQIGRILSEHTSILRMKIPPMQRMTVVHAVTMSAMSSSAATGTAIHADLAPAGSSVRSSVTSLSRPDR